MKQAKVFYHRTILRQFLFPPYFDLPFLKVILIYKFSNFPPILTAHIMTFSPLFNLPPIPHDHGAQIRRFHPSPPTSEPKDLYVEATHHGSPPSVRFIRKDNPREALIYIDGACSNNGTSHARAGFGVIWGPRHHLSGRLEGQDPETSNRAELRAAIVALGLRAWNGEGFDKVVLACDSEYVVKGISEWVRNWQSNGWRTARGTPVENRDLWEMLLAALREQDKRGVMVQFWLIPREQNEADAYAKAGTFEERPTQMGGIFSIGEMLIG